MSIDIHGREYVMVNERIKIFRDQFEGWSLTSDLVKLTDDCCVVKATVTDKEGNVKATGYAQEDRSSSNINKTSYVENCVPLDTQILTKDGWKYYYQIHVGDLVWSHNMETGVNEFTKVTAINTYKNRSLVKLSNSRFEFTCTPSHKWLVREQGKGLYKTETSALTNRHKIVTAVRTDIVPSKMGLKLGWLMCDSIQRYTKGGLPSVAYISQAKYVEEVKALFGEGKKVKKYSDKWKDCYEWIVSVDEVREILGYFDMIDYTDLPSAMSRASLEDVAGCYESMMMADGSNRGFSSTYIELIEAMQIMCARLGIATNKVTDRMCKKSTRPIYTLAIKKTDGAYFSEMDVTNIPPKDVWCPTTENGTWCARQNGFVSMTSNCETSAWGRALACLGIGIDGAIASTEEVVNAVINQNPEQFSDKASDKQIAYLKTLLKKAGYSEDEYLASYGVTSFEELPKKDISLDINKLKVKS
jgi:hypothetical protein